MFKLKNAQWLSGFLTVLLSSAAAAKPNFSERSFNIYGGIDLQQRDMDFQKEYGKGIFANRVPQLNLYMGAKLHQYFGIEVGYQSSNTQTKGSTLFEGDVMLGVPIDPGDVFVLKEKITIKGSHLNLVGFLPMYANSTQLIGSIGISLLTVKLIHQPIGNQGGPLLTLADLEEVRRIFYSRRAIPRLSAGIQHQFSESYGIRTTIGYEATGKFKNLYPKNVEESVLRE